MTQWKPRKGGVLPPDLSSHERRLLAALEGDATVEALAAKLSYPVTRVEVLLRSLVLRGALEVVEARPADLGIELNFRQADPSSDDGEAEVDADNSFSSQNFINEDVDGLDASALPSDAEGAGDLEHAEAGSPDGAGVPSTRSTSSSQGVNLRQLYQERLAGAPVPIRAGWAATASEPELSALCLDPVPAVIKPLFDNPRATARHARLVAFHHRTPQGLETVAARTTLLRDPQVERLLLGNPQLPASLLRRILTGRRLLDIYKVIVNREVPEQSRRGAGALLRQRFATGAPEERLELILNTEGRALSALAGLPVDGRTAALLCQRQFTSSLLVQNIARWSAAPPQVLVYLMKQPFVRRQPVLRNLLLRHPNLPPSARGGS